MRSEASIHAARRFCPAVLALVTFAVAIFPGVTRLFGEDTGKSTAATNHEETQQRHAASPFAKGTIESIDLFRHQLKLKTGDTVRTFTYAANTYIFRGKEKITPDALKKGELIALRIYTDPEGREIIRRIKAYGVPTAAGTETPSAAEPTK
jgi:Cu/Ag efflux protein CusF